MTHLIQENRISVQAPHIILGLQELISNLQSRTQAQIIEIGLGPTDDKLYEASRTQGEVLIYPTRKCAQSYVGVRTPQGELQCYALKHRRPDKECEYIGFTLTLLPPISKP